MGEKKAKIKIVDRVNYYRIFFYLSSESKDELAAREKMVVDDTKMDI